MSNCINYFRKALTCNWLHLDQCSARTSRCTCAGLHEWVRAKFMVILVLHHSNKASIAFLNNTLHSGRVSLSTLTGTTTQRTNNMLFLTMHASWNSWVNALIIKCIYNFGKNRYPWQHLLHRNYVALSCNNFDFGSS